ncbi:hypothetical protein B0O99DRAFT_666476 [Bisporella sp. PMI_857]|jgi:hypothetical protein|nr:hypothetical protein B0O99DRAFT_666476 [Bisporella sp. PMI_857]
MPEEQYSPDRSLTGDNGVRSEVSSRSGISKASLKRAVHWDKDSKLPNDEVQPDDSVSSVGANIPDHKSIIPSNAGGSSGPHTDVPPSPAREDHCQPQPQQLEGPIDGPKNLPLKGLSHRPRSGSNISWGNGSISTTSEKPTASGKPTTSGKKHHRQQETVLKTRYFIERDQGEDKIVRRRIEVPKQKRDIMGKMGTGLLNYANGNRGSKH